MKFQTRKIPIHSVIDQDSDSDYVLITIKIPGLECKRKLNLSKAPKNGRLVNTEYKKK